MSNKKNLIAKIIVCAGLLLLVGLIVFWAINPDGLDPIKYWCFYWPVYKLSSLLGIDFYMPYILEVTRICLALIVISALIVIYNKQQCNTDHKDGQESSKHGKKYLRLILSASVITVLIYFFTSYVTKDFSSLKKGEYVVEETNFEQLARFKSSGRHGSMHYRLGLSEMDVFQYRELKKLKESIGREETESFIESLGDDMKAIIPENWDALTERQKMHLLKSAGFRSKIVIKVYYLPQSKQMMKYEISEKDTIKK